MQSIKLLLKTYKISIKDFGTLYMQTTGKPYHKDIDELSDKIYKKIESLCKERSGKSKNTHKASPSTSSKTVKKISPDHKTSKKANKDIQIIKPKLVSSVDFQDDFLAGLGFDMEEPTSTQTKSTQSDRSPISKKDSKKSSTKLDTQEDTKIHKQESVGSSLDAGFGNAKVIRSEVQDSFPVLHNKVQGTTGSKKHTHYTHTHQKSQQHKIRGNVEFLKTSYKTKEFESKQIIRRTSPQLDHDSKKSDTPLQAKTFVSRSNTSKFAHKGINIDYNKSSTTKLTGNLHIQHSLNKNQPPQKVVSPKIIKEAKTSDTLVKKTEVVISDSITVKEFSEKIGVPVAEIIKKLLANKILGGINTSLDFDTVSLIASEFDVNCIRQSGSLNVSDIVGANIQKLTESDKDSVHAITRPPIITVMGHVDHGKTKLLDYIRKTNIISGEAGGITQSIGASQIVHNGQKITFIDTPGHELFTSLRSRGAKLTDICIIVIAADDGIKPQTVEAIAHAKDSGVPIIIAITKIDKGIDNTDMIKSQMAEHDLIPEDRGGPVPLVKVSALTGQGIDDLLDQIVFQVEVLDLKYDPTKAGLGVILESTKDAKQGVVTTAIVMSGTLSVGDVFVVHNIIGKVKRLVNSHGKNIHKASGGDPVKIYGMSQIPEPGRILEVVDNEKTAHHRVSQILASFSKESNNLQSLLTKIAQGDQVQLKLILKADGFGSLEALKYSMSTVPMPANIHIKIVHSNVGNFSDSDLELAKASDSIMLGFNLDIHANLRKKADQMKITLRSFHIIYEIIDYVEQLALGLVKHEAKEVYIGKLDVLAVFYRKGNEMIIGGKVQEGEIRNGAFFKIWRNGEEIGGGKVTSLQKGSESVSSIGTGYECGMKIKCDKKVEESDTLEYFVME